MSCGLIAIALGMATGSALGRIILGDWKTMDLFLLIVSITAVTARAIEMGK